jgi:leucyl-tRNA synthetase
LRKAVHKTIAAVTNDIEKFAFNRAVARIYTLTNSISAALEELRAGGAGWVLREALDSLTMMIGPMMPHLAEELWQRLGHQVLLTYSPWPEVEAALTVDDSVTVAVQVNGKLRATLDLVRDTEAARVEAAALALPEIERLIGDRTVRRVIVVPNRVVNVVL